MLLRYFAAVAELLTFTLVPEVALDEVDTHHPFGFSNVTLVSKAQPKNAHAPMLVTLSPIVTLVREVQFSNAEEPMLVTLSPIVTLVRE